MTSNAPINSNYFRSLNDLARETSHYFTSIPSSVTTSITSLSAPPKIAVCLTAATVSTLALRSLFKMYLWRRALRTCLTNDPPPGPTPLPFLGNLLPLSESYYSTLYDYVDHPVSIYWVLSTPFLVVNDEDGLRRVLGGSNGLYTKPKYFGYRSRVVTQAVKLQHSKVVQESRDYEPNGDTSRIALENLTNDSVPTMKNSMESLLRKLVSESGTQEDCRSFSTLSTIRETVVQLNLKVLFGLDADHNSQEDPAKIGSMIGLAGTEFARRMVNPLKMFWDIPGNIRYMRDVYGLISLGRRLCKVLDDAGNVISKNGAHDNDNSGEGLSGLSWVHAWVGKVGKVGKLGKVVGLLMASTQTVPLTAVWMLHLVGTHPEVRKKLLVELNEVGAAEINELTPELLGKLKYANAVISETLRLFPPFPLIQREAQDDDNLCGIRVTRGTPVYVVPWLIHRNPKFWPDADEFKPQRFIGKEAHGDGTSDWVYLPFGRGSRMCAGSKLAMMELKVLLACAVLGYEWEIEGEHGSGYGKFPELGMVPKGIELHMRARTH